MPAKNRNERTAQAARKGATAGRARQEANGKPGGPAAKAPEIIGASLHSVKFVGRSGAEVYFTRNNGKINTKEFEKVFDACWKAYQKASWLIKKEKTHFNPLQSGLSLPTCLFMALDGIKKLVPRGFQVNLDFVEKTNITEFHINVFKECGWNFYHHFLPVGDTLMKLYRKNRRLHDLFVAFLKQLTNLGINLWDQGAMGWDLDSMDDRLINNDFDDEKYEQEYKENMRLYRSGIAAKYSRLIRKTKLVPFDKLKQWAQRFKSGEPISNLVYQGCCELEKGYKLSEFSYYLPHEDYINSPFLEFESTINIIWQEGDALSSDHADSLDALAQEGVQMPTVHLTINDKLKSIDFKEMEKKSHWPIELSNFYGRANKLIKEFNNERKNRNAS